MYSSAQLCELCEPLRCKLPVVYKQLQCHWLYLHFRPGLVRLRVIVLPFKSIYYQTGRAWQKQDFRLKNVNDYLQNWEALEINNWTFVCPLNSTHEVGRTTRNKTDSVLSSQFNVYTNTFITILGCTCNLAALGRTPECIHLHMFDCQRYIVTIVMFLLLLSLSNTLYQIMHFYRYHFVDNIPTDIYTGSKIGVKI